MSIPDDDGMKLVVQQEKGSCRDIKLLSLVNKELIKIISYFKYYTSAYTIDRR